MVFRRVFWRLLRSPDCLRCRIRKDWVRIAGIWLLFWRNRRDCLQLLRSLICECFFPQVEIRISLDWYEMTIAPRRAKNSHSVIKTPAQPKRSIDAPEDDHPIGLWMDNDLLRQQSQTSQKPAVASAPGESNRYLELADLVLRRADAQKQKKKIGK
jgi:hypothetical protein